MRWNEMWSMECSEPLCVCEKEAEREREREKEHKFLTMYAVDDLDGAGRDLDVEHCNTLQHTATHCDTLQHIATNCNTLQQIATRCNTLDHTNAPQYTATHCNIYPTRDVVDDIEGTGRDLHVEHLRDQIKAND